MLLHFRKKYSIFFYSISGKKFPTILRSFSIYITNGIHDGDSEHIRIFQFGSIFGMVGKKKRRKKSKARDTRPFCPLYEVYVEKRIEREYLRFLMGRIYQKNSPSFRSKCYVTQVKFILQEGCLHIAYEKPGSESDILPVSFFTQNKRVFVFGSIVDGVNGRKSMQEKSIRSSFGAGKTHFFKGFFVGIPAVELFPFGKIDGYSRFFLFWYFSRKREKRQNPGSCQDNNDKNNFFHKQ